MELRMRRPAGPPRRRPPDASARARRERRAVQRDRSL